ncbi:MAG TPA: hypothetical protein PK402_10195, partial [Tepidisphaeraceae bacterium]|nr:hypothetical protein [Tepidisphaeraceae bacterium]
IEAGMWESEMDAGWYGSFWPFGESSPSNFYVSNADPKTMLGFGFDHWSTSPRIKLWAIVAPFWSLATLTAILPLIVIHRKIRSRHRDPFACPTCGYDLRATPDRCPECGAVASQKRA